MEFSKLPIEKQLYSSAKNARKVIEANDLKFICYFLICVGINREKKKSKVITYNNISNDYKNKLMLVKSSYKQVISSLNKKKNVSKIQP